MAADPAGAGNEDTSVRRELGALRNGPLWTGFVGAAIGFGGMFAVYSYVEPTVTRVTGLASGAVPLVLAIFGVGMTVGTVIGGRLADRSVMRTVYLGFVSTGAMLALFALTGQHPVPAVLSLFLLGVTSQILGLSLQTRLMDLSPSAPSLGAALCHSALNVGNANGAFLGGLVIAAGWGYLAPPGRGSCSRWPAWPSSSSSGAARGSSSPRCPTARARPPRPPRRRGSPRLAPGRARAEVRRLPAGSQRGAVGCAVRAPPCAPSRPARAGDPRGASP